MLLVLLLRNARARVVASAQCSFLSSKRGEDLDRRVVWHTTRVHTYIKKRACFISSVGERNHQKMTQQQQRMSSQAERGTMKKIVFYCPEMEKMAREVRANDPGKWESLLSSRPAKAQEVLFFFSLVKKVCLLLCVTNTSSLVNADAKQMPWNWARSNGGDFQTGTRTYLSITRTISEADTLLF